MLSKNPNAAVAGGSSGVGVLAVWLLGHFGVAFTPEVGAAVSGATATLALLLGKRGIVGIARTVWFGRKQQ